MPSNFAKATFAGGCFWCTQEQFDAMAGVIQTTAGYIGGETPHPTYEDVCEGITGHLEAVEIVYDPQQVSYTQLLDVFFKGIDPTDEDGQFVDIGTQYQTAVFYHDQHQLKQANDYIKQLESSGRFDKPIVTKVIPVTIFYPAEEYHQHYCRLRPTHYRLYKEHSGRIEFKNRYWHDTH